MYKCKTGKKMSEKNIENDNVNGKEHNDNDTKYEAISPTTLAGVDIKDIKSIINASKESTDVQSWSANKFYNRGQYSKYNQMKYECIASHTSKPNMNPQYSPDYWKSLV